MASFYLDHDIPGRVKPALVALGHGVLTSNEHHSQRANDAAQLLTAAQTARVLVSHNRADYRLLHQAWLLWSVPLRHAGILIVPQQRWTESQTASEVDRVVTSGVQLVNTLHFWSPSRGWARFL